MKKENNNLGLLIQAMLLVYVIFSIVLYFYEKEFLILVQMLTSLFLFVTAYNNQVIYKRKFLTITYIVCGLIILGIAFFG